MVFTIASVSKTRQLERRCTVTKETMENSARLCDKFTNRIERNFTPTKGNDRDQNAFQRVQAMHYCSIPDHPFSYDYDKIEAV